MEKEVWADLHIHTIVSDGKARPEEVVRYALRKGISVIAITDHNTFFGSVLGAIEGKVLGKVLVIPGAEVRTFWGDILILCPQPTRLSPDPVELSEISYENNCVLIPAHPFDLIRKGIGAKVFLKGMWNAVECFNGGSDPLTNLFTYLLLKNSGLPCISNSDAHVLTMIGSGRTRLTINPSSIDDALDCIRKGYVHPIPHYSLRGIRDRLVWGLKRKIHKIKGWPGVNVAINLSLSEDR